MDDFDLRDMLSPPLRFHAEEMEKKPVSDKEKPKPAQQLAMAYVPSQAWEDLFEPDEALQQGTLFRQLWLPFEGGRSK